MKVNRTGVTRIVFVFKNVVVKIPNPSYSWFHFLKGLVANIQEGRCWRYNKDQPERLELLCPVVWTSWGGWILIMKKADTARWLNEVYQMPPLPDDWFARKDDNDRLYKKWIDAGFGGDDKCDNYGYYENRLVKIDYA